MDCVADGVGQVGKLGSFTKIGVPEASPFEPLGADGPPDSRIRGFEERGHTSPI